MIKPLNSPQLSSMKPRCGLQKISDLVPRLIRQYELQAELMSRINQQHRPVPVPVVAPSHVRPTQQATFNWDE